MTALAADSSGRSEKEIAAELVARIGSGDPAAESAIVRRYGRGVLYFLRRKTGDPALADDLYQDTFRIALEKLRSGDLRNPEMLAAFLHGIAGNLVIGHYRREHGRATDANLAAIEKVAIDGDQFDSLSQAQIAKIVRRLLDEMTQPRDREILLRVFLDDQDKALVCAELGLDSLHFNRVLHRAKQRFKALLVQAERRERLRIIPGGRTDSVVSGRI